MRGEAPASELRVRGLRLADLPGILRIERRSFATPWSLLDFAFELAKPSSICLAALADGQLAGYLVCSRQDELWHVMNLAVDSARRRRGIGSALLRELLDQRGRADARYVLETRQSDSGAIALYERFGFRVAGVRPGFYRDNGEEALIMWRTPPPES